MSKSFEEFYESWMEEQLYMAGKLWEEEQFIQEEIQREKSFQKVMHEYNQRLPWEIQKANEGADTTGSDIPFTVI